MYKFVYTADLGVGFLFVFFNVRVNKFHCVITRIADVVGISLSVDE